MLWIDVTKATLKKETISLGLAYSLRGSAHYRVGGKHGGLQSDMALVEPRVLHLHPQAAEGD